MPIIVTLLTEKALNFTETQSDPDTHEGATHIVKILEEGFHVLQILETENQCAEMMEFMKNDEIWENFGKMIQKCGEKKEFRFLQPLLHYLYHVAKKNPICRKKMVEGGLQQLLTFTRSVNFMNTELFGILGKIMELLDAC